MHFFYKNKKTLRTLFTTFAVSSLVIISSLTIALFIQQHAKAVSLSNWNPGLIISDDVFTNKSTLSASQIQAFLNSKVTSCDTNGTQPSEFGGGTRAQWGTAHGYPPPYTCLKDYSENGRSSAQIIYDTAQQYSINPQVLIVLLQKEQGLVTDTWPLGSEYKSATGYGCPDTASCDSTYYGFTNQVTWSAKMFRAILNQSSTWYSPYIIGNNYVQWSPTSSCGGTTVNLQNLSTVALYDYTPYQPNQSALNAGYGSGDSCSSYGNRNFYLYYNDWFGSSISSPNYSWSPSSQQVLANGVTSSSNVISLTPGGTAKAIIKAQNTGNQTWQNYNTFLGTTHAIDRASIFASGDWFAPSRPAILQEPFVEPGGTGTFEFTITAPNEVTSSREYFNILTEGVTWHQDAGLYYDVNVANPPGEYYNVNYQSYNLYSDQARTIPLLKSYNNVVKGSTIYGSVSFKNTGNSTLDKSVTLLATTSPRDHTSPFQSSDWMSSNRITSMVENSVAPGATGTILFTLQAPQQTGLYTEAYGMVVEGKAWMDNDKLISNINVVNPPQSILTGPNTLTTNSQLMSSDLTHKLVLQNDGNLVLYNNNQAVWATNTSGAASPITLIQQNDGNLVLYGANNKPLWYSNSAGTNSKSLVLQSDGNLVLYDTNNTPHWATNTRQ